MLKKLMKYEFMAMGRVFLPLFAALILLSLINRLLSYLPVDAPQVIGTIISVVLMVGIMVLTLVLTLQRFRKNLLSNEGHLMMTLPVKADRLILSKLFVAAICGVASVVVVAISIVIMAMTAVDFSDFIKVLKPLGEIFASYPAQSVIYVVEAIILMALSVFSAILMLYTCMSLSMLVNKRRGLFTFGAFVVITTVLQTIAAAFIAVVTVAGAGNVFEFLSDFSAFGLSQIAIWIWIIVEFALCAAFYVITRYMLKNRLNLQ